MLLFLQAYGDPPRVRRIFRQRHDDLPPKETDPEVHATKRGRISHGVLLGPEDVYVSPLVGDLTLDDFPDEIVFTDEVYRVLDVKRVVDGQEVVRSVETLTLIYPYGTVFTPAQLLRLREIFEGVPPGNPNVNVRRPFATDGALDPTLVKDELSTLLAKQTPTAEDVRLIMDLEKLDGDSDLRTGMLIEMSPPVRQPTTRELAATSFVDELTLHLPMTDVQKASLQEKVLDL